MDKKKATDFLKKANEILNDPNYEAAKYIKVTRDLSQQQKESLSERKRWI